MVNLKEPKDKKVYGKNQKRVSNTSDFLRTL